MAKKMNVSIRGDTKNENLEFIIKSCTDAANTFVDALPACEDQMYFKAIGVKQFEGEGAGAKWDILQDVISTALMIAMKKRHEELKGYTIDMSTGIDDGYHVVMLHAKVGEEAAAEEKQTES
jgi:hypothetical protein